MRYELTLVRMDAIIKSINKCRRGCIVKGTLIYFCWECKLVQTVRKTVQCFLKKLKYKTHNPSVPLFGLLSPKNENSNLKRYMQLSVHSSSIYNSQDTDAIQMPTQMNG